jgi:hypothetical protein
MISEMFFETLPALQAIFELGVEIKNECFYEFTDEHYDELKSRGIDYEGTMYMFIHDSYKHQASNEIQVASESEKNSLLKAAKIVESYCGVPVRVK